MTEPDKKLRPIVYDYPCRRCREYHWPDEPCLEIDDDGVFDRRTIDDDVSYY